MRVPEMTWKRRFSACANGTQAGGADALAELG